MCQLRSIAISLSVLFTVAVSTLPAFAYDVITVTDGGTIKGKVTYAGPPATKKIIPSKDIATCGGIREEPEVVVGPDKGVQDAVVYLKNVAKGQAFEKPAKTPEIVNHGCNFEPHVQAMPVGSKIAVVNADPVMHNTHSFWGKITIFNLALPLKGQRIEKQINQAGLVRVECDTHGWMRGWVHVGENPYYAVTGKDGSFLISGVPPGTYTLVAWQEYTGETEVPVTVAAKGTAQVNVELKKK
jgi:plastocyanin